MMVEGVVFIASSHRYCPSNTCVTLCTENPARSKALVSVSLVKEVPDHLILEYPFKRWCFKEKSGIGVGRQRTLDCPQKLNRIIDMLNHMAANYDIRRNR